MVALLQAGHMPVMQILGAHAMTDTADPLALLSDRLAQLVDRAAPGVVAVHAANRWSTSGIHWSAGIVVTAEEAL